MTNSPFQDGPSLVVIRMIRGFDENEVESEVKKRKAETIVGARFREDDVSYLNWNVLLGKSTWLQ
jgi:hypothetical protein